MVTIWLMVAAAVLGLLVAMAVLWPLRHHSRRAWVALCLAAGIVVPATYHLVGTPQAAAPAARNEVASLEEGIQALERALAADPRQVEGWALLGRARASIGQHVPAAEAFARAVALAPEDAAILVEAAQARAEADPAKRFDDTAVQWLRDALRLQPGAERAAWLLGIALRQRGQDAEAVAVWSELLPRLAEGPARALSVQIERAREGGAATPDAARATPAPGLQVRVELPPGFEPSRWPADTRLFVIARIPGGAPMPVAVKRLSLDGLPVVVSLDDADSPMPTAPLSTLPAVDVVLRLSRDGTANPGAQDLQTAPIHVALPHADVITPRWLPGPH